MSLIQLSHINIYVPERQQPILADVNLQISSGEWVSIVGTNGSGKSLLGKLVAGLHNQYQGDKWISEQNSSCQYIMQNPDSQLIGETVWEDVCFGLEAHGLSPEIIEEKATIALERVGLSHYKARSVHTLSGGQKQLLALAGAVALNPTIIIADEITAMLDPASRQSVLGILRKLNGEGVTIIAITQLLEELTYSSRIIAIDRGNIVYQGSKERFFYNGFEGQSSVCEDIGLEPPFTVRVAKCLLNRGIQLDGYPIIPEELLEAVAVK